MFSHCHWCLFVSFFLFHWTYCGTRSFRSRPHFMVVSVYKLSYTVLSQHWALPNAISAKQSLPNITGLSEGDAALSLCIKTKTEDERVYDDQRLKAKIEVLRSNAWPSREQRQQYFQPDHCSLILTPLNIYALKCLNRLPCWTLGENQRIFGVPLKSDFGQPFHHPWEEFCNFKSEPFSELPLTLTTQQKSGA